MLKLIKVNGKIDKEYNIKDILFVEKIKKLDYESIVNST